MANYSTEVNQLLEFVGGKENVATVSHCATRMRFVLNDPSIADEEKIQGIEIVKGTFTNAGQFQVIIGNEVPTFYNEFIKIAGIDAATKDEAKKAAQQNMTWLQRMLTHLSEIFAPLIPAIITGGLILGFRNVLEGIKFYEDGTKTIIEVSQFWAGTHSFLWLIGEAIFHYLPVGITWSIAKKMGTTQILGIVLGICLVSPQLLNAYGVAGAEEIPFWDFGYFTIDMIGYQAQVLPAIFAGFALAYLEIWLRKIIPASISMIFVPFFSLVPAVLLAHTVLGPIGWKIGEVISNFVYSGLTSSFGVVFAALFGFLYAPFVITGLHHMTNAIDLLLISDVGGTNLWPMIALSNIAQGSAVLGIILLNKKDKEERQVSVPATISCYLGVTEPAMFGINLKYGFPFFCAMIGSAIAAIISVGGNVHAFSIGIGGLPGIISIQSQYYGIFAIAMLVAVVVPLVLTYMVGKRKGIGM